MSVKRKVTVPVGTSARLVAPARPQPARDPARESPSRAVAAPLRARGPARPPEAAAPAGRPRAPPPGVPTGREPASAGRAAAPAADARRRVARAPARARAWRPSLRSASIRSSSGGETQLLQAKPLTLGERLTFELGERRALPHAEGLAESCRRLQRFQTPRLCDEILEPLQVELAGLDAERISRATRHDPVTAQELAQLRDVHLQGCARGVRRLPAPELVDQALARARRRSRAAGAAQARRAACAPPSFRSRPSSSTSSGPRIRNSMRLLCVFSGALALPVALF